MGTLRRFADDEVPLGLEHVADIRRFFADWAPRTPHMTMGGNHRRRARPGRRSACPHVTVVGFLAMSVGLGSAGARLRRT
jgi:hypothetical protein